MEIWVQKIQREKNILNPKWKCGFVGGSVRLLVPCPGLLCRGAAVKQGRRYFGEDDNNNNDDDDDYDGVSIGIQRITMMMMLVMMVIWIGIWAWGHEARQKILWW